MTTAETKPLEVNFLEVHRDDIFSRDPFIFHALAKEEKIVLVRELKEILLLREQVLLYIKNNYSANVLRDVNKFLHEALIPSNASMHAMVTTLKLFRNSRFMSCLFIDLISRFGLPDPIMIDPGHFRIVATTHYKNFKRDPRFKTEDFIFHFPRDDFEPIFSQDPTPIHRDMNFRHYSFQMNFWFPFHEVSTNSTLMFFPDSYHQPLPSYPKVFSKDSPDEWGYGQNRVPDVNFGDLLLFHSEQFHASPVSELQTRRVSVEMRVSAGCIDDNSVYRRHFWNFNNFIPKSSDQNVSKCSSKSAKTISSQDRAISLIENIDSDFDTLACLEKEKPNALTSQNFINAMFPSVEKTQTDTVVNNSKHLDASEIQSLSMSYEEWDTPTLLKENIHGFNAVGYKGLVYAILQSEGAFDIDRVRNNSYSYVYQGLNVESISMQIKQSNKKSMRAPPERFTQKTGSELIEFFDLFLFSEDRSFALAKALITNGRLDSAFIVLENIIKKTESYFWSLVASRWLIRLKQFKIAEHALSKVICLAESSPICDGGYWQKLPLEHTYRLQFYPQDAILAGKTLLDKIVNLDPNVISLQHLSKLDYRIFSPRPYECGEFFSYDVFISGSLMVGLPKNRNYEFDPTIILDEGNTEILVSETPSRLYRDIFALEYGNVNLSSSKEVLVGYLDATNIVLWRSDFYTVPKRHGCINFFSSSGQDIGETHKALNILKFIS